MVRSVNLITVKSKAFALRIVKLYKYLRARRESVMAKQVLRSGTSIGANIAEGQFAQSKSDFLSKYQIALKEASETLYWLELLQEAGYLPDQDATDSLLEDCRELVRLLVSSVKTGKGIGEK